MKPPWHPCPKTFFSPNVFHHSKMVNSKCRFGTSEELLQGLLNVAKDIDAKLDYLISDRDERRPRQDSLPLAGSAGYEDRPGQ